MAWDTANNIINDAALELGLLSAAVSDAYASTDANVVQLRALLKAAGRALVREHPWTQFLKEDTIATEAGVSAYDLPEDFLRLRDQSAWNRTESFPLAGPVDSTGWQLLKSSNTTSTYEFYFRVVGTEVWLHPTPTSVQTLALEYVSDRWVGTADDPSPTLTAPTDYTHVVWLEGRMMVTRLKRDFLRAKGLDSTAATMEYEEALSAAKGGDGAAPVLNLARAPLALWRPLDGANVPDSGLGS